MGKPNHRHWSRDDWPQYQSTTTHARRTRADGTTTETMGIDMAKGPGTGKEMTPGMRQPADVVIGAETGNALKGAMPVKRRTLLRGSGDDRDHLMREHTDVKTTIEKKVEGLEEETAKNAKTVDTDTDRIREHVRPPGHQHHGVKDTTDEANIETRVSLDDAIQEIQGESAIHTEILPALNAEPPRQYPTPILLKPSSGHYHPLLNLPYAPKAAAPLSQTRWALNRASLPRMTLQQTSRQTLMLKMTGAML